MEHEREENQVGRFGAGMCTYLMRDGAGIMEFDREDSEVIFFRKAIEHSQMAATYIALHRVQRNESVNRILSRFAARRRMCSIHFAVHGDTGPPGDPRETEATATFSIMDLASVGRAA